VIIMNSVKSRSCAAMNFYCQRLAVGICHLSVHNIVSCGAQVGNVVVS